MKRAMSILLLLMLNGICQANLLKNPSFEVQEEQNSSMPEFWTIIKKGTFEESNALEEKIVFVGKRAVSIHNENPALQKAILLWSQGGFGEKFNKIAPGTDVEFSVMATASREASSGKQRKAISAAFNISFLASGSFLLSSESVKREISSLSESLS